MTIYDMRKSASESVHFVVDKNEQRDWIPSAKSGLFSYLGVRAKSAPLNLMALAEYTAFPERYISHKPVTEEEAILLLEAENHEFQPFISLDGDVRVVYRLKNGGYGVLRS